MTFEDLQNLVARCTAPHGAPFYRRAYGMSSDEPAKEIRDWNDWLALPFVSKDTMLATPFEERIFEPIARIDHLRASSGTSGKPPLFSPRTFLRHMEYRTEYHDFKNAILAYGVPAAPYWHEHFQATLGHRPQVIVFDPKNPAASVRLARIADVDSISTFAFHIRLIGEAMLRENMNEHIRFIEICGEACTQALLSYMRETFPNATVVPFYGASEIEDSPMGMPCRPITGEEPLALYHAKPSQYHEVVDPETDAVITPQSGVEGELIVSAYPGDPAAFPLIRYRTGDMIRVIDAACPTHRRWSFTVLGRVQMDFLKISGGVLRADETERVVRLFPERLAGRFELHRYERETPDGPKTQVELHVELNGPLNLEMLARDIATNLRVNPSRTYAQGVADGLYLPLTCVALAPVTTSGKTKRLIAH